MTEYSKNAFWSLLVEINNTIYNAQTKLAFEVNLYNYYDIT